MKRQILTIAAVLALVFAGAIFAQSPQNTTAPGPTTQREPGLTNNNLPNPGNPLPLNEQNPPAEGTATELEQPPVTETETTTTETTTPEATTTETTTTTTTTETDVDQGAAAETETGAYAGDTDTADDSDALPATAGELPMVALIGLLAFGAFFVVRARRNA